MRFIQVLRANNTTSHSCVMKARCGYNMHHNDPHSQEGGKGGGGGGGGEAG